MNKNLKKVISSVAALTMVASSVAAFAVDFPDVESTASYAQAVQELSALDVISGYEDGTFGPDKLVTRAEITKMIVDALAERSSAEASTESTKFADVSADHWAKGYINQGVADGFIAGMSDTEFDPDANVTYVQAQKMLVSAIGYETFAQGQGGWPTGYKTYAASLDITKGISGIKDSTELTRAQVAQMIDNAMDAPLCVIAGWKPEWNGTQTPNLEVRDGKEGRAYETLFTEKHDAYKVYGRVTETSKTGSVDNDKVTFQVEKADNFDDEEDKADSPVSEDMYIGDSKADNYLRTYSQALIQKNDDDEFTILSIAAAAANKSVTVASEDFDENKAYDMLAKLNINPDDKLKTMSKGTREKVQLILVMSRNAQVYFLDEPIGGVDPAARDYILNTIITNYNPEATVIISTHLISDIENVLDDVVMIKDGELVMHKKVDEIREEYEMSVDEVFREVFRC